MRVRVKVGAPWSGTLKGKWKDGQGGCPVIRDLKVGSMRRVRLYYADLPPVVHLQLMISMTKTCSVEVDLHSHEKTSGPFGYPLSINKMALLEHFCIILTTLWFLLLRLVICAGGKSGSTEVPSYRSTADCLPASEYSSGLRKPYEKYNNNKEYTTYSVMGQSCWLLKESWWVGDMVWTFTYEEPGSFRLCMGLSFSVLGDRPNWDSSQTQSPSSIGLYKQAKLQPAHGVPHTTLSSPT